MDRSSWAAWRGAPLIAGALALALSGCGTSYKVMRLPPSGALGDKGQGLPITLTRPEFTVKKVEGSDPPRYAAGVVNVPDAHQRYAVSLSPALLSKITFDAAFNEAGGLTSTSADSQEQIGPAVTTLFTFATTVAGVATKGLAGGGGGGGGGGGQGPLGVVTFGFRDIGGIDTSAQHFRDCLDPLGATASLACALDETGRKIDPACLPLTLEIARREAYHQDGDGKDKGTPFSGLYAGSPDEARCLSLASALLKGEGETTAGLLLGAWKAKTAAIADPALRDRADATFKALADGGDVKAARRLMFAMARAAAGAFEPLHDAVSLPGDGSGWKPTAVDLGALGSAMTATGLDAPAPGPKRPAPAQPVVALANGKAAVKGVGQALALDPGPWRGRRLTALQTDLDCAQRELLQVPRKPPPSPPPPGGHPPPVLLTDTCLQATPRNQASDKLQAQVDALTRYRAELVNMGADYDRMLALQAFLTQQIPTVDSGLRLSPSAEYLAFAKEAATIQTDISTQVASAQGAGKPAATAEVLPPVSPWVSETACIAASKADNWIYGDGADAPDFVVVLRPAEGGPAIDPPAHLTKGCGQ